LKESGLDGEVEITVSDNSIVISPVHAPREGWSQAFRAMAEYGDDSLVDGDQLDASGWDENEWQW
jgi:antitoxin MazE